MGFDFVVLSIYSLTAEYLVPNIGKAVWLLYSISQVYAYAIYIVILHSESIITFTFPNPKEWCRQLREPKGDTLRNCMPHCQTLQYPLPLLAWRHLWMVSYINETDLSLIQCRLQSAQKGRIWQRKRFKNVWSGSIFLKLFCSIFLIQKKNNWSNVILVLSCHPGNMAALKDFSVGFNLLGNF